MMKMMKMILEDLRIRHEVNNEGVLVTMDRGCGFEERHKAHKA